ncbi:MAG: FGGY family carbohydrate kinase, partial [Solirubrobacteraceae bacterium]
MSDGRVIGIDVGTSSVKAIAVDEAGAVVGSADRSYPVAMDHPGWSEQDPALWWDATQSALAEVGADRCDGIGFSGQMHGLVALDGSDAPLRPAILWNDGRSQPQVDALLEQHGVERLVELSGNRPLAGFTAPKLLWLAEHEPELLGRFRRIWLPKDYVRLRLTGEAAC